MDKTISSPGIIIKWEDVKDSLYSSLNKKLGWFHESVDIVEAFHLTPLTNEVNEFKQTNIIRYSYYICAVGKGSGKIYSFNLWSLLDREKFEVDGNKE